MFTTERVLHRSPAVPRRLWGSMEPKVIWIIATIVIAAIAIVAFMWRKRRSAHLRQRFGPEYDRAVEQTHGVRAAEAALEARARRVDKLHIKPLTPSDASGFGVAWQKIQAEFVDDPKGAVTKADRLIGEVMRARGYPLDDFEQRANDLSVDHPAVVTNYRAARAIALRHAQGQASTEDLRQAMVLHRSLFEELLVPAADPNTSQPRTPVMARRH